MTSYLALDAIKPGDIILSSARTKTSATIRATTFSNFSHAALAIHPLIWFETLGSTGVRYLVVQPKLVWDGERFRLGMPIPRGERYQIKRMNGLYNDQDASGWHIFAKALIQESTKHAFLNYALAEGFLPILKFGLGETTFARFVANNMDKSKSKLYPGPFCSWLVAECCENLGHKLFEAPPQTITPRALDRSDKLHNVDGKFSGIPADVPVRFNHFEHQIRVGTQRLENMVSVFVLSAIVTKETSELKKMVSCLGKSRAVSIPGRQLPLGTAERQDAVEQQVRRNFAEVQVKIGEAISLAYTACALSSEEIEALNECRESCQNARQGAAHEKLCDTMGCFKISSASATAREVLYQIFPQPVLPPVSFGTDDPPPAPPTGL